MSGSGNVAVVPPEGRDRRRWRGRSPALLFLLPAIILLGVWVVYPALYTIARSFFGREGFDEFVGIDNYKELFTDDSLVTAIKNNADRKSTRLNSSHANISYAVFCLKKKKTTLITIIIISE